MPQKLGQYDKVDLFDGLVVLLELEDESHRWITSGITDTCAAKNIDETLAYQYVLKLYPYVTNNIITLEESEFQANTSPSLSDHYETMPYWQAIRGLSALVNRFAFYDFSLTPRNIDKATPLIRFTWESYIRYRLDTFSLPRYKADKRIECLIGDMPIISYEELAFITGMQVDSINRAAERCDFQKVHPQNGHKMLNYGNNYLNNALNLNILNPTQRRAFVPLDSALTWLACRGKKSPSPFRPSVLTSINDETIPNYWSDNFWSQFTQNLKSIFQHASKQRIKEITDFAGISPEQIKKIEKKSSALHLGQALLMDQALDQLIESESTPPSASIFKVLHMLT